MRIVFAIIATLILAPLLSLTYAEEITITIAGGSEFPLIDGTVSYETEWKRSSEHIVTYENGAKLVLRSVHDRERIYLLLDMLTDTVTDYYKDQATICFDTENDKGERTNENDYCFVSTLGSNSFLTYKGGGNFASSKYLDKIPNPEGSEARAGISNKFDRYSEIPHLFYEFKIPVQFLTQSNVYGFYFAVYDANTSIAYSLSEQVLQIDYPYIQSPNTWARLVSPDNSLPEFPSAINIILFLSIATILIITYTRTRHSTLLA